MKSLSFALYLALLFCGCSTSAAGNSVLKRYSFDFSVKKRQKLFISQAFCDAKKTYIQFEGPPQRKPAFYLVDGKALTPTWQENIAQIPGLHPVIIVRYGKDAASVIRNLSALGTGYDSL